MRRGLFQIIIVLTMALAVLGFIGTSSSYAADAPGFFRYPHTNGKDLVFTSEGDLWRVPLKGGTALRLTTQLGEERFAHYSPDSRWIAFSEQDDGQDDVFIIPAEGGEPQRLTFHPSSDQVLGWTSEGKIIFRSPRDIPYRGYRIYTIPPEGGYPVSLGLDKAALISFEPKGKRLAFNRYSIEFRKWKRYQGGWAQDIWVGSLEKKEFTNITNLPNINDWDGADAFPMWHTDGRIYFLSDRDGRANIYSMLPDGRGLQRHTKHEQFDVRWPALGGGTIVYQLGMDIWVLDIARNETHKVDIQLPTDRVQARQKFVDPKQFITYFELSPDAKRLMFNARGELFTVPSKGKGLVRQLTYDSGVREKFPHWAPEGKEIFFWSDESGEEKLYRSPAEGGVRSLVGTDNRGWHYPALPSPDGKRVAFSNEELELVVMEVSTGKTQVVDKGAWEITNYNWSPDSRFLTFSRPEPNYNNSIRIWDSKENRVQPVTDDYYHNYSPVFSPDGKYLFFISERICNPHLDWRETLYILDKRAQPFVVLLKKETLSPFAPLADPKAAKDEDEDKDKKDKDKGDKKKDKKDKKDEEKKEVEPVQIDFEGLSNRTIAVPVEPGNYFALNAVEGKIFYVSVENRGMLGGELFEDKTPGVDLHRFDLEKKKGKVVEEGIRAYDISRDGKKMVIWKGEQFMVRGIDEEGGGKPWEKHEGDKDEDEGERFVDLSQWDLRVDVRAEWRQMFLEAWRLQRDFFWDPNLHRVAWKEVYNQYAPLAERISTREELNDLIGEMFAELNCSHTYNWGGDMRRPEYRGTGLLGVDLTREASGFYRIDRVIPGKPWNEELTSPLGAPGIDAKAGDYIVAINGHPTNSVANIYELLLSKAGKITSVTLNAKPALEGGREVIVKPLGWEGGLRYWDWTQNRRAYVASKSGGGIGYIHLTDMGGDGLSQFTESYLPQHDKPALIMDVRYNGGGFVAEMILSHLNRQMFAVGRPRHGTPYRTPNTSFYGYMAAVCNAETGSDGETFTEGFKRLGLGPVIGTRTWGGWVGIRGDKPLVDRGMVTQPEFTGWGLDSKYLIEGWGTDPDMIVEEDPGAYMRGEDPQLDATIKYLMDKMAQSPKPVPEAPPFPDRSLKIR